MTDNTDCLVLCIDDLITIKLFVLYDVREKMFFVRGKNYENSNSESDSESESESGEETDSCSYTNSNLNSNLETDLESNYLYKPFSFSCKKKKMMIKFIEYLVSVNSCEFTLYNYDNLPFLSEEISYDFLEKFQDTRYEIVSYEKKNFDYKICMNLLNLLKNIYNNY